MITDNVQKNIKSPEFTINRFSRYLENINEWFSYEQGTGNVVLGDKHFKITDLLHKLTDFDQTFPDYLGISTSPDGQYYALSYLSKQLSPGDSGEQSYRLALFRTSNLSLVRKSIEIGYDVHWNPSWRSNVDLIVRAASGGVLKINCDKGAVKKIFSNGNVTMPWSVNGEIFWLSFNANGRWEVRSLKSIICSVSSHIDFRKPVIWLSPRQKIVLANLNNAKVGRH